MKILAVLSSALPSMANADPEAQFWSWFVANERALYRFTSPTDPLIHQLGSHLKQVHQDLTFEIGLENKGEKRDFVISADGVKAAFAAVEALHAAAPKLDRWNLIKYRPGRLPMYTLELGEHTFDPAKVLCMLAEDGEKIGIVLMYENFEQDNDVFTHASFLLLDQALGEYVVETQVGFVNVQGREAEWVSHSFPMDELAAQFQHASQQRAVAGR